MKKKKYSIYQKLIAQRFLYYYQQAQEQGLSDILALCVATRAIVSNFSFPSRNEEDEQYQVENLQANGFSFPNFFLAEDYSAITDEIMYVLSSFSNWAEKGAPYPVTQDQYEDLWANGIYMVEINGIPVLKIYRLLVSKLPVS